MRVAGSPRIYVATPAPGRLDTAYAWVLFRTGTRVNARLLVARVGAHSGRSYAARGTRCVRSTLVLGHGRTGLHAGSRYPVRVYARTGIGRHAPRTLIYAGEATARAFRVHPGHAVPTTCS